MTMVSAPPDWLTVALRWLDWRLDRRNGSLWPVLSGRRRNSLRRLTDEGVCLTSMMEAAQGVP